MADKPATKAKCRTLIVEDDVGAARALEKLISREGHDVMTAGTLGDALGALSWKPHCIILDLILPDGNGVTVLRRVRKSGMDARIAIITGMEDPFAIDQVTDLQPDVVFEKPLDGQRLVEWLRSKRRSPRKAT